MSTHKDLPPGSSEWARSIDEAMAKLAAIEAVARRICSDFGLDFANPQRGINAGGTPSVKNPVPLKLPSLADLNVRDAVHGDVLTFDQPSGTWVARAWDAVQLPKVFPVGDPDSYYTPPAGVGTYAENLFPNPEARTAGTGEMPKWFDFYEEYTDQMTVVDLGDGTKAIQVTAAGDFGAGVVYFEPTDNTFPSYMDSTKCYVVSVDLTVSSPLPTFYPYMPVRVTLSGDNVHFPVEALASGTVRVHACIQPDEASFGVSLEALLDGMSGYLRWSNFQVTEVPVGFRRITHLSFPNTETIDVTANCEPGKSYLVVDSIDTDEPLSFSIEATTPSGSTVLFSRDETQWPEAIVDIPADATSVSYTTVKTSGPWWHNVNIVEVPSDYGFFEGSTPGDVNYTYSWAGTADDSTSVRTPN